MNQKGERVVNFKVHSFVNIYHGSPAMIRGC